MSDLAFDVNSLAPILDKFIANGYKNVCCLVTQGGFMTIKAGILLATLLIVACSHPNASGVYVATAENEVILIQLIQAQDGKLTGRIETMSIGADGSVNSKHAVVDGAVAGRDILLRPANLWFGGVQASGAFSNRALVLTGNGTSLEAERASLDQYQAAVGRLTAAAELRRRTFASDAAQQRLAAMDLQISQAAASLRRQTSALAQAVSRSPNFGQLAAANTARISQMVEDAAKRSGVARSQLAVAANQIAVETEQVDVARSQYAVGLNAIVDAAHRGISAVDTLCRTQLAVQLATTCKNANDAVTAFKAAAAQGRARFIPYKDQVQDELARQSRLAERIE